MPSSNNEVEKALAAAVDGVRRQPHDRNPGDFRAILEHHHTQSLHLRKLMVSGVDGELADDEVWINTLRSLVTVANRPNVGADWPGETEARLYPALLVSCVINP